MGLFLAVGCKKDDEKKPQEPDYPIEIPFMEYSLAGTCQWINLAYDNTIIVINSNEQLSQYMACTGGGYPEIDFEKQTLLLASGKTNSGIIKLATKDLQQLSLDKYELNLEIDLFDNANVSTWSTALVVGKVSEESILELNIILLSSPQEPCSCIMDTLKGEWSWIKIACGYTQPSDNEFKSIIKILSQNEDSSINYEVFVEDTLFSRGSFQIQYNQYSEVANIKLPHQCYSEGWNIWFSDTSHWRFWDNVWDGCYYLYQKIE
jgi:hypothetical protein